MVLRVEGEHLLLCNIGEGNDEDEFLAVNPGFIKVDELPYSVSGHYAYDEEGNIVIDKEHELESMQLTKMDEILFKFDDLMYHGEFECSLGFRADNRRGEGKDDKDNVSSLIDLGQEPIYFRDADNGFHVLSIEQMTTLKNEMIYDGLSKYQWKWTKEMEVMSATTCEELEAIEI